MMRVGAVNYLNSKPLIHRFAWHAKQLGMADVRLLRDLPSRLADSLSASRLDVALVPVFEVLANPEWKIVSNACVAADGPVSSVKVYFRTPPSAVRTLALDEGSRTSAALCRFLLLHRHGVDPIRERLPIGQGLSDATTDAILLIGDRAMQPPEPSLRGDFVAEWDLAEEWRRDFGLPFVFAVWAAQANVRTQAVIPLLEACRDDGLLHFDGIAEAEGPPLGLTVQHAERYLRQNLRFTMGARESRAIEVFRDGCRRVGLLPEPTSESELDDLRPVR